MRKMVINKPHSRFRFPERTAKRFHSRLLMPQTQKIARRIQHVQIIQRPAAAGVQLQIMPVQSAGSLPAEANFIDIRSGNLCEVETSLNGELRKPGVMFLAGDSLFRNRKK